MYNGTYNDFSLNCLISSLRSRSSLTNQFIFSYYEHPNSFQYHLFTYCTIILILTDKT